MSKEIAGFTDMPRASSQLAMLQAAVKGLEGEWRRGRGAGRRKEGRRGEGRGSALTEVLNPGDSN